MNRVYKLAFYVLLTLLCTTAFAQQKGTFNDPRDKKVYKWIKIGEQTWMGENLNAEVEGGKCYDNKPANCAKYGRLYTWKAAQKACPSGWHLPTEAEWEIMTSYIGGANTEGKYLKAKSGWNNNGNGIDKFGFAALPGGIGFPSGFGFVGVGGYWWRASENNATDVYDPYYRSMLSDNEEAHWNYDDESMSLFNVRCLRGTP